jgi:hypothetical protein
MITTEENIVYQLLEVLRASELNNDEVVGEREVRAYMRVHRAELIHKYSLKGLIIQDVCFQTIELPLIAVGSEFAANVPAIIRLPQNFGIKLSTHCRENIPVVSEENFTLSLRHPINKYQPKGFIQEGKLVINATSVSPQAIDGGARIAATIAEIEDDRVVHLTSVLDDPSISPNYDWTVNEYPFPQENIKHLKDSILRREFNLILQTKSDQVGNFKQDNINYHAQNNTRK